MVFPEVCVPRPGVEKALLVRPNDAQRRTLGKTMVEALHEPRVVNEPLDRDVT